MSIMILVPAYGRDYHSKAEVVGDFLANKDFQVAAVGHCGYVGYGELKQLATQNGDQHINIRYSRLRKVVVLRVDRDGHIWMDGVTAKPVVKASIS